MKKILIFVFAIALTFVSCTDEGKFNNPATHDLDNGGFVKFNNRFNAPSTLSLADGPSSSFSAELVDVNNNLSSFSLTLVATVAGDVRTVENFKTFTSLPADLTISLGDIVDALGMSFETITFGDQFQFIGVATRNDGEIFRGITPSFDDTDDTVGIGNTEEFLLNTAATGYYSAMNFGIIVACSEYNLDEVVGNYNITVDPFGAAVLSSFDVVEDTTPGNVVLIDPMGHARGYGLTSPGTFDITMQVNGATNSATIGSADEQDAWDTGNFGLSYGIARLHNANGLFLPCANLFIVDWQHSVDAGTWGSQHFEAERP